MLGGALGLTVPSFESSSFAVEGVLAFLSSASDLAVVSSGGFDPGFTRLTTSGLGILDER